MASVTPVIPSPLPMTLPVTPVPLIEIFSAIQGEGLNVGTRQIFVRFAICDLRCRYCDSAHTWQAQTTCRIEQTSGQRDFLTAASPVSAEQLLAWINQLNDTRLHDSISLTGGEPLLHAAFLQGFLPQLRVQTGLPIYLETAGHLPAQLSLILPSLDLIGMDIKLPSVSGELHWAAHREFLQACLGAGVAVFTKLIIAECTEPGELLQAATLLAEIDPAIPLFLQPVTPLTPGLGLQAPRPAQVLAWQALLKEQLQVVRVVPQTHKMLNQL
jgi:7-carboxy-7-deazaguanine synthase